MATRKLNVVSLKQSCNDDCKGMPVVSWVCQGDGGGDEELGIAGRLVVECLTARVCL